MPRSMSKLAMCGLAILVAVLIVAAIALPLPLNLLVLISLVPMVLGKVIRLPPLPTTLRGHAAWSAVLSGLFVVADVEGMVILFVIWAFALIGALLAGDLRPKRLRRSMAAVLVQCTTAAAVIATAAAAPIKQSDQFMALPVTLSRTEMSLGELQRLIDEAHDARRVGFPVAIHMNVPPSETEQVVRWERRSLTLREFVVAIEVQTPLRHQFGGCGNGHHSILFGGNCVFGLWLRDPGAIARSKRL